MNFKTILSSSVSKLFLIFFLCKYPYVLRTSLNPFFMVCAFGKIKLNQLFHPSCIQGCGTNQMIKNNQKWPKMIKNDQNFFDNFWSFELFYTLGCIQKFVSGELWNCLIPKLIRINAISNKTFTQKHRSCICPQSNIQLKNY